MARRLRRTGLVAAVGVALLGPAAVALAAANGTFNGTTAQGKECGRGFTRACLVRVEVTNGYVGKAKTSESQISWRAKCKSGKFLTGSTSFWGGLTNGSLTVKGHYVQGHLGTSSKGRITAHNRVTITVHVAGNATGTVKDSSVVYEGSTSVDQCHTGTVGYTARK